jgi:hypothetical protein
MKVTPEEREAYVRKWLTVQGWTEIFIDDDPEYLYPPGRPRGWIKLPSMRLHTLEQAFNAECLQEA